MERDLIDSDTCLPGEKSNLYIDDNDFIKECREPWHMELEAALLEGYVDRTIIKNICKCRVLPSMLRADVWKICLNIASRGNALKCWDKKFDLPEQNKIHEECQTICGNMKLEVPEQTATDLEAVITFYCKSRAVVFEPDSMWTNILCPIAQQGFGRVDLYNSFYAVIHQYIPRKVCLHAPYNLFRLLLLYHDPELCSFLDSHKVSIELLMKPWFTSLFSSCCKLDVTQALWDIYLQRADPFFLFSLALVILVNAKEQIISTLRGRNEREIVKALIDYPMALEPIDVEDFCQLAVYFADKTPRSVRQIYQEALFAGPAILSTPKTSEAAEKELAESLCLHVGVSDILLSHPSAVKDGVSEEDLVHFFLVDCRSPDLYNAGHLSTAFHFDATLMMREPDEFLTAIEALLEAQEQATLVGSTAGGEHLCLIGSGVEEEDQYMHMVVAHLLRNHHSKVSIVHGGFKAIQKYLLHANLNVSEWIVGTSEMEDLVHLNSPRVSSHAAAHEKLLSTATETSEFNAVESLMKTFTTTLKTKSQSLKQKVTKLIDNPDHGGPSHVTPSRQSRAYRGTQPVFSIGDEDESTEESPMSKEEARPRNNLGQPLINLTSWMEERKVEQNFDCYIVSPDGRRLVAHLVTVGDDLLCLRQYEDGKCSIVSARPLSAVSKITSKRACPELITFRFKFESTGLENVTADGAVDRYLIPEAGLATRYIKQQIMRVLDGRKMTDT